MIDRDEVTGIEWLDQLADELLDPLCGSADVLQFAKGERVFNPLPEPREVFVLQSGLVRIYRESRDADEVTFGFIRPGELLGEAALFVDQPRESYAVAVEPSRVLRLDRQAFYAAMIATPEMGYAVARQIENRFKDVENRLEDLVFRGARGRMAHLLVALAEQFGEAQPGQANRQATTELNLPLTQQDLASMIGISRPTASIAFNELEKAGYVGREGRRILVTDIDRLRADADHL